MEIVTPGIVPPKRPKTYLGRCHHCGCIVRCAESEALAMRERAACPMTGCGAHIILTAQMQPEDIGMKASDFVKPNREVKPLS